MKNFKTGKLYRVSKKLPKHEDVYVDAYGAVFLVEDKFIWVADMEWDWLVEVPAK